MGVALSEKEAKTSPVPQQNKKSKPSKRERGEREGREREGERREREEAREGVRQKAYNTAGSMNPRCTNTSIVASQVEVCAVTLLTFYFLLLPTPTSSTDVVKMYPGQTLSHDDAQTLSFAFLTCLDSCSAFKIKQYYIGLQWQNGKSKSAQRKA